MEAVQTPPVGSQARPDRLKITEIFHSIQGEANTMGWPTVFVRLTGCPLRCQYCDTEYAFYGGEWKSFDEIIDQISGYQCKRITVTGGEPLAQKRCYPFVKRLCDEGFDVSLETSGAMDISTVDTRVSRVMDLKTPASGEMHRNLMENLQHLTDHDQLKFVVCDRQDYEWARDLIQSTSFPSGMSVLISPSAQQLKPADLADWVIQDQLNVRFQIQMHKYIWGDEPGR